MRLFKKKELFLPIPPPPPLAFDELPKAEHVLDAPEMIPPISVPSENDEPVALPEDHMESTSKAPPAPAAEVKEALAAEKYVEKNDYETVLFDLSTMESTIRDSQGIMDDLLTIKSDADHSLEEWRATLEDVERKLLYVDKVLFETNE